MACEQCNGTGGSSYLPPYSINTCSTKSSPLDSSCVKYTGPALVCTGVETNTWLEDILQAFDTKICESGTDWSAFEYNCLTDESSISTPGEFVDAITLAYCTLNSAYITFTGTTYPTAISGLQSQITAITNPNLTLCGASGITSSDTYTSILGKLATLGCNNSAALNVSGANWNTYFVTPTLPTNPTAGFNVILAKLGEIISAGYAYVPPTFNNTGSCLASPGTADILVSTINKIKTRLCLSPIYDINTSPWGCIANPASGTGPNLQAAFDAVLATTNTLKANDVTFDPDFFDVSLNTIGQPCSGRFVTFTGDLTQDRFVASDSSDTSPGTLADKLTAGTNITLDNTTTPGQIIINSTEDHKVIASLGGAAGFLNDKVNGEEDVTESIEIQTSYDAGTDKVLISPIINALNLASVILDTIEANPELYAKFCALGCGCAPCGGSTTTTTLGARARVAIKINNTSTLDVNTEIRFDQNAPTLGIFLADLTIPASSVFNSGYYDLTTPILPMAGNLTVNNLDDTTPTFNFDVEVQYPNGSIVPGSSSGSATVDPAYVNTNFSLGSTYTDVIIVIHISN